MFDIRYHVASLAAVFIALIIGILVGVAISGSGFVEGRERDLLNRQIEEMRAERDQARTQVDQLGDDQRAAQSFVEHAYPAVMQGRLRGRKIAVLYVGAVDPGVSSSVNRALADAGAGTPFRVRILKVPVSAEALDERIANQPALLPYLGDEKIGELGRELGEELVKGGETPLWRSLSTELVTEQEGPAGAPVDGVVVVRGAKPQQALTARFLNGLYRGVARAGAPAVGAERTGSDPSAVPAFRKSGLSSVDDVESGTGRLALALLLAGSSRGHYGLKPTATDGVLPPLEPLLITRPAAVG
jgi:hypothetical protein